MGMLMEFFNSPLWTDTIQDFVLSHCQVFTGEEEYSLEHMKLHKEFCTIIENTLNIYLLDILGVPFNKFKEAVVAAAHNKDSVANQVLSILLQSTDFTYFAAKMYAFNVMLDSQVCISFLPDEKNSFFVTQPIAPVETLKRDAEIAVEQVKVAQSEVTEIEEGLGIDPTIAEPPRISEEEKRQMKLKIKQEREQQAKAVSQEEIQRRKEAFRKRREEIVEKQKKACKENIELNLKKREQAGPVEIEDPNDAIRKALAARVKVLIDQ